MRQFIVAALAAALPAQAQEAGTDATTAYATLTCAEFSGLDEAAQMQAMLDMRAVMNGEPLPMAEGETADAPTDAPTAAAANDLDGAAATAEAASDPAADAAAQPVATDPKLSALRSSCANASTTLAMDAMRAAHADYE
ncbi:hypothetical protein [Rubellimicrobium roseum]|uniref:HdeA/HdeB family protein n=1 Tax=Rubellimicrobium roseum TaxID=687525 RepID=A0A5C4NG15_9RHOB|nr:hypothetical protein [Rubellimicrobium roseum]TNC73072.1 hypothetical protein FHG71_07200 [Rubellimicrobium roseum]